ncbi:Maf-like protein [Pyrococcus furiosus COM1]|nr:Maf-like protein [Pyrococcus furiosus COM1]
MDFSTMKKIILASSSPRRREILSRFFDIIVHPSNVNEDKIKEKDPTETAIKIAKAKAFDLAVKFPTDTIIAADTIVTLNGKILGKPKDSEEARKMLKQLSGKTHEVVTGYCIISGDKIIEGAEITKVKFRELSDDLIEWYISTQEWRDKAGGYGIQGFGAILVEHIEGDYYNVVGLPIIVIIKLIELGHKLKRIF